MSADLTIDVKVTGLTEAAANVQSVRNALADRQPLHERMAMDVRNMTRQYLIQDDSHATAQKLGANPTGFRAKFGGVRRRFECWKAGHCRTTA